MSGAPDQLGASRAQVLMQAGPQGLSIVDIIQAVNRMGLTEQPWDVTHTKRSSVSSVRARCPALCPCEILWH